jgi:hypothetical protein
VVQDSTSNVVLTEAAADELRDEFLSWQCKIRQMAVRRMAASVAEHAPDDRPPAACRRRHADHHPIR